jgi:hypothetical protein
MIVFPGCKALPNCQHIILKILSNKVFRFIRPALFNDRCRFPVPVLTVIFVLFLTAKIGASVPAVVPCTTILYAGLFVPIPNLLFTSSYAEVPKRILPFVACDVDCSVRFSPDAVPPIAVCHPDTPVERLFVIVLVVRVRPVEKVRADSFASNAACRSVWSARVPVMSHHSVQLATSPYSSHVSVAFTFTALPAQPTYVHGVSPS